MAHHTEQTGFPAIPLNAGMRIRLEARSPTTDAAITGVIANIWSIYGRDESDAGLAEGVIPVYTIGDAPDEGPV